MPLPIPRTRAEIEAIQAERRRIAVERARRSELFRTRLAGVDPGRAGDSDQWRRIPILTKEDLRRIPAGEFHARFCIGPRTDVLEYWRSGGVTGQPLFYPRSAEDLRYALLAFQRIWPRIGAGAGDTVHVAFPLGIHPIGHLLARSAQLAGLGVVWAGSGTSTPSLMQLDLIQTLRPTIWAGMSSYGLHLANLAEAQGIDLAASSVRTVLVSAEPLTQAKRAKIERVWGARVHDSFGMTEGSMISVEGRAPDPGSAAPAAGMSAWTDLFYLEVVDEATGEPVPDGTIGSLVVTPLWNNTLTPFLRWKSGDLVSLTYPEPTDDPFSVFPLLRHAHRTTGFFKVRGINLNHTELEDHIFLQPEIADFKGEVAIVDDQDVLTLAVEIRRGVEPGAAAEHLAESVRRRFEVRPRVEVLPLGTLAREFESSVKAPRFLDRRP
jgi:phenylacetate-CoA ligase